MIPCADRVVSMLAAGAPAAPLPLIVGGAVALLFLFLSLRAGRRQRLIDNVPTSKTSGVFIGLVELTGSAESPEPLTSYLAEVPCVYYRWSVEEHWSRTVTEHYTDSKGKRRTRTRRKSGWRTVADGDRQQPFYLKDDCGIVLVRPAGAKIEADTVFREHCTRGDRLYYAKGPAHSVSHSDHRRRFTERAIPLHAPLYVMGKARQRQDVVAPEIAADADAPVFLISTRSEQQITTGLATQYWVFGVLGALAVAAGALIAARMVAGAASAANRTSPRASPSPAVTSACGGWAGSGWRITAWSTCGRWSRRRGRTWTCSFAGGRT